jgi:hypothetical protein
MPHLWFENSGGWEAERLSGAELDLSVARLPTISEMQSGIHSGAQVARLVRSGAEGAHAWALIAPAGSSIRVNGRKMRAGLRALADRDEIRAGDKRFFYSAESIAEVVAFPGASRAIFCGRCRLPIAAGDPAVCCPGCGIWHHQGGPENRMCWTYAAACSCCDFQTPLNAGLKWVPEEDNSR